ncbi:MAG: hypothetical protein U1G07_05630 [Verrucomicrobiota bacterium]
MRPKLDAIRSALLVLHKTLIESEKVEYEKMMGKIPSPNHFLQLLINDPWFVWLSPLSQLIVSFDEALDGKEPLTQPLADSLLEQTGRLLVASETGPEFSKHYHEALQRDPDVVMAQGEIAKLRSAKL